MDSKDLQQADPLQIVLDNTPAGVYVCDIETYEIIFSNKTLRSAFPHDLEGRKCWEVLSTFDKPCPYCKLHKVLNKPMGQIYSWENYNPDLNLWFQMNDSIVTWTNGKPVHLITINDISKLKKNELELEEYKKELEALLKEKTENEQKLKSMSDNMPNTFTFQLLRKKGEEYPEVLYISGGVETICGVTEEDLINHKNIIFEHILKEDREKIWEEVVKGQPFRIEIRFNRPDTGQLVWLSLSEIPRINSNGETVWDGTVVNINSYKRLEEQLIAARIKAEESDKMKSVFMTRMTHEVKTPLNAILGFLDLLGEEEDPSIQNEYIRIITDNANQMLNLIVDLFDISKIDAGHMKITPETGNLHTLLHDIHASFMASGSLGNKPVALMIGQKTETDGIFTLDYVRLRQILDNLIGNAIKFTEKGFIRYGYAIQEEGLYFYVQDTGIGIPAEAMKNLGKPFRQLHDRKKASQYGGTGIGLSISIELVKLMGGRFWVDSEVNKGSRFQFVIPCPEIVNCSDSF